MDLIIFKIILLLIKMLLDIIAVLLLINGNVLNL